MAKLAAAMMILSMTMAGAQRFPVTICKEGSVSYNTHFAQGMAKQMFAAIQVDLTWTTMDHCPAGALQVRYNLETPDEMKPGALAYALPYEKTHIVVFLDRVEKCAPDEGTTRRILAHVLAHEITHMLQGVARHSDTGVMKARYTGLDYSDMSWKPLKFATEDISLIHDGLTRKQAATLIAGK